MRRYRRLINMLLIVFLLAALLSGCGNTTPEPAPTVQPTVQPASTPVPTAEPSPEPTAEPTPEPTPEPPPEPTAEPVKTEFLDWTVEETIPEAESLVVGTGKITYPVFEGRQADALNRLVEMVVGARKEGILQSMRYAREEWELMQQLENEWDVAYEETEDWSSARYTDAASGLDCLVLTIRDYSYTGGAAHGFYETTYLVTDQASGEQIFLADLLRRFGTNLESVGEALVGICEDMAAEDDMIWTSADYIRNELTKDGCWYPDEDGLHFVAPVYALGPYARGEVELILTWDMLAEIPAVDSGVYDRGEGSTGPVLDVRCRDYSAVSLLEVPVIAGADSPAAEAINDELAQLARSYYAEVAENTEQWQELADFYIEYHCYPCTTDRYLNVLESYELTMDDSYVSNAGLYSWVYDKELHRRVTLTDALLMSGYHYEDFQTLLSGALSQCNDYSLINVAFRMLPEGRPEFYLLVWWTVQEEEAFFSYSAYTFMRIGENGSLYPCEGYVIDPAELDSDFSTGPLVSQAVG